MNQRLKGWEVLPSARVAWNEGTGHLPWHVGRHLGSTQTPAGGRRGPTAAHVSSTPQYG